MRSQRVEQLAGDPDHLAAAALPLEGLGKGLDVAAGAELDDLLEAEGAARRRGPPRAKLAVGRLDAETVAVAFVHRRDRARDHRDHLLGEPLDVARDLVPGAADEDADRDEAVVEILDQRPEH